MKVQRIVQSFFMLLYIVSVQSTSLYGNADRPLFSDHPALIHSLPHVPLGNFPTPIIRLHNLERSIGKKNIYLKHDGMSGGVDSDGTILFGGNKVRKLEFIFADVLKKGLNTVITFGGVGSNHATATAAYAQQLGLHCVVSLKPQSHSAVVQRNLLLMQHYGADFFLSDKQRDMYMPQLLAYTQEKYGSYPYSIPVGGSYDVGIVGFVNALYELRNQMQSGDMPEPDVIYVATGSFGTIAGLLLGIKALGLKTKVVGVPVYPVRDISRIKREIIRLCNDTNQLLYALDSSFPLCECDEQDVELNVQFTGQRYGDITQEGTTAIDTLKRCEGIILDGVYAGKAFAALLHDIGTKIIADDHVVLFWNTFCSDAFSDTIVSDNYQYLPDALHTFFVS